MWLVWTFKNIPFLCFGIFWAFLQYILGPYGVALLNQLTKLNLWIWEEIAVLHCALLNAFCCSYQQSHHHPLQAVLLYNDASITFERWCGICFGLWAVSILLYTIPIILAHLGLFNVTAVWLVLYCICFVCSYIHFLIRSFICFFPHEDDFFLYLFFLNWGTNSQLFLTKEISRLTW